MKRDIYQNITDQIVSELEKGVRPWQKPWSDGHMDGRVVMPLRHNGIAYRGVNILTLWMAGLAIGYRAPTWMTFKQAIDFGGGGGGRVMVIMKCIQINLLEDDIASVMHETSMKYLAN